MKDIEQGVTCPWCETNRPWGLWALAHWDEVLVYTCPACGKGSEWLRGHLLRKRRTA